MTDQDELHELSGAYALNALDESDRKEFERYLAGSEDARTEVAELSHAAVALGMSVRPVTPPPALKANLMALIAVTPQLSRTAPVAAVPSVDEQRSIRDLADGRTGPARSGRAEATAQQRWYRKPLNVIVAAAAAIALFAGGAALGQGLGDKSYELAQANSLAELTAASDVQQSVSDVAGGGSAKLLWSDELDRSAVLVDGLPQLEADRIYQLWYINDEGATSAGTFSAAESGTSWRVLDGDRIDNAAVGITVEPSGGSTSPTTDPLFVIDEA